MPPLAARGILRRTLDDTVDRVRRRGRTALFRAARLTGAAVLSYLVALSFSPEPPPLLAPLTALLVVQVTLASTLDHGVERVVSVVAGVLLAMLFAGFVGLEWWSLGLLIAASIVLGQLLRLGPHMLEVPISAMLVLGVASSVDAAETAALSRAGETLVGAAVGVLVNLAFPPAVRTIDASTAVEQFAGRIAALLEVAADELARGAGPEQAARWMEEARSFGRQVVKVDDVVERAVEGRRLNVRALGTPEVEVSLRRGFEALEHSSVAVRSLFRSILDGMQRSLDPGSSTGGYASDVRGAFSVLLEDLAVTVRAYGRLVAAEIEADTDREESELATALEALREARARVADLLLAGPREDPQYWEFNVALLSTVERILGELDVEERARQHARRAGHAGSPGPAQLAERIRATTRHLGETTRHLGESTLHLGEDTLHLVETPASRWSAAWRRGVLRRRARRRRRP